MFHRLLGEPSRKQQKYKRNWGIPPSLLFQTQYSRICAFQVGEHSTRGHGYPPVPAHTLGMRGLQRPGPQNTWVAPWQEWLFHSLTAFAPQYQWIQYAFNHFSEDNFPNSDVVVESGFPNARKGGFSLTCLRPPYALISGRLFTLNSLFQTIYLSLFTLDLSC